MRALWWYGTALLVAPAAWAQTADDPLARALAAVQRGDCSLGVPDLQSELDHSPNFIPVLNGIAVCEAKSGHYDNAAALFARITPP